MLVIRYDHLHAHLTTDHTEGGPQKFHAHPTPRIGGVPVLLGATAGMVAAVLLGWCDARWVVLLGLVLLPAYAGGLTEDLTKRVGPLPRLLLTFVSGGLAFYVLDAQLPRLDVPGLDFLMQWQVVSLIVTVVTIGGVAHAVNIIDGFNGLAGMVVLMILSALGYVAFSVGDTQVLAVVLALMGATTGFLVWNYPRGLIFAGDGGAYLWGTVIGVLSVLLIHRHPEVSPWFPLTLTIYPVWETLFSAFRRKMRGASPGLPDSLHFHSLIYKRLIRWMVGAQDAKAITRRNSMTAPYLWGCCLFSIVPGVLFWRSPGLLAASCLGFVLLYLWLYRRIVRFKTPKAFRRRRSG